MFASWRSFRLWIGAWPAQARIHLPSSVAKSACTQLAIIHECNALSWNTMRESLAGNQPELEVKFSRRYIRGKYCDIDFQPFLSVGVCRCHAGVYMAVFVRAGSDSDLWHEARNVATVCLYAAPLFKWMVNLRTLARGRSKTTPAMDKLLDTNMGGTGGTLCRWSHAKPRVRRSSTSADSQAHARAQQCVSIAVVGRYVLLRGP